MRILCTGARGFVGRHVVELLNKSGYTVLGFDKRHYHRRWCMWGDITNLKELEHAFMVFKPEAVIHLAAQPSLQESWKRADYDAQVNILGTINLLGLCQRYKVKRFVFASTSAVYAPSISGVYNEASLTGPLTPYGVSKLAAENYIRISRVPYTILRLGNVYGPRQKSLGENQLIPRALAHIYDDKSFVINGDGEQKRDFVYVEDVADAFLKAIGFNLSQTFNIGSGETASVNDVMEIIRGYIGKEDHWWHGPSKSGELRNVRLRSESAAHYLKWFHKTSLYDGLIRTVEAWKSKSSIPVS